MAQTPKKTPEKIDDNTDEKTPDEYRDDLVAAMLDHVPFDGWSLEAQKRAAEDVGVALGIVRLAFPGGVVDMIDHWADGLDRRMLEVLAGKDLPGLKIRERITLAVRTRLELLVPIREAEKRALAHMALPGNAPRALIILNRTADKMWRAAGDTSTDYNFYTKRLTLDVVLSTTLLYFLGDESEDYVDTWDFLDRRIDNVMSIEKTKFDLRKKFGDTLPNLVAKLGKWRYPAA